MRGFFRRLKMVLGSKAHKALDKAENPNETLDCSYRRQLELLQKVYRGVADVATSRKRLELQINQQEMHADRLHEQARKAMSLEREDLAREALTRRSAITTQLKEMQSQHDDLRAEEEKLRQAADSLRTKVEMFRSRKETLKARYNAARARVFLPASAIRLFFAKRAFSLLSTHVTSLASCQPLCYDCIKKTARFIGETQDFTVFSRRFW